MTLLSQRKNYKQVRSLILDTCNRFQNKHGGDFNELVAEANLCFVIAYNDYDPARSQFSMWLRWKIWHGLLDMTKKNASWT